MTFWVPSRKPRGYVRHRADLLRISRQSRTQKLVINPEHRNLWFKNNDPRQEIMDYRMTVHIFGNGPSPAVTAFGMRKTAEDGEEIYGEKTKEFTRNDFYVDDGLTSKPSEEEVIDLVSNAQACLETANLYLHKVASNST